MTEQIIYYKKATGGIIRVVNGSRLYYLNSSGEWIADPGIVSMFRNGTDIEEITEDEVNAIINCRLDNQT